jgi:HAD superfamily hydrolase (TIGR01484 family)
MQPLSQCPPEQRARIRGVLTDIDDTLTTHGQLTALAYSAMERIHRAGAMLIPITGRPAGWCDHIARMWPVDAVVGENGAFWFRYDPRSRQMERHFAVQGAARQAQRERLDAVAEHILRDVPNARIAADQRYRETDLAIDYCEDVKRLSDAEVEAIVSIMLSHGLTAKVSSIHVNGWIGTYDKLTMTLSLLRECFGFSPVVARDSFAFIGDSPNDQSMFEYFSCSVGVANVRDFESRITVLPAYVTMANSGAGFAEFSELLFPASRA